MRARTDCAGLVAQGSIRINRQPTGKPHAKLRVGDVLTIPVHGSVRVLRVAALAARRGPASDARLLYADVTAVDASPADVTPADVTPADVTPADVTDVSATSCVAVNSAAYRAP
jgi:ribosome-associated heat shock protein Hsp15